MVGISLNFEVDTNIAIYFLTASKEKKRRFVHNKLITSAAFDANLIIRIQKC